MHALVTGASGFLGSRLVERLLQNGAEVSVLVRPSSRLRDWPGVRVLRAEFPKLQIESARNSWAMFAQEFASVLATVTHVFHCAGCATDWATPEAYEAGNVDSTAAMLDLARTSMPRLERFLHVSTTDVYGYPEVACDEGGPLVDVDLPYNRTKIVAEKLVRSALVDGMPITIVRPATIYGPGSQPFVSEIAEMLRARLMLLVDGGRHSAGLVYLDDACDAMVLAATASHAQGETYNVVGVASVTWRRYCEALALALGLPMPFLRLPFGVASGLGALCELPFRLPLPGKPVLTRHAVCLLGRDQGYRSDKARHHLGWQPAVGLEEGVRRSAEWFRALDR